METARRGKQEEEEATGPSSQSLERGDRVASRSKVQKGRYQREAGIWRQSAASQEDRLPGNNFTSPIS